MNWRLEDTINTSPTDSILSRSFWLHGDHMTSCTIIGVVMLQSVPLLNKTSAIMIMILSVLIQPVRQRPWTSKTLTWTCNLPLHSTVIGWLTEPDYNSFHLRSPSPRVCKLQPGQVPLNPLYGTNMKPAPVEACRQLLNCGVCGV